MIGIRDIRVQADRPLYKIDDVVTFTNSPSTIHIIGCPEKLGNWKVVRVYVDVVEPDDTNTIVEAVNFGQYWSATLPAPSTSGKVLNGVVIKADAIDEKGELITGFVFGKTCYLVMDIDRTIDETTTSEIFDILKDLQRRVQRLENRG